MKAIFHVVLAGVLAVALAACSSSSNNNGNLKDDVDRHKMQAEQLDGQITAAMAALTAAGAVGDDLAAQVADIVSKVSQGVMDLETANGAINAAVAALQGAGLAGADLAALVAAAVVDVGELAEMAEAERITMEKANRANFAKVHELLAKLTANEVDVTVPKDAMKMSTQADPTMTAWPALYDIPTDGKARISMDDMVDDASRVNGSWSAAVVPGRSVASDEKGKLSASGTFRDISGTFTCAIECGTALIFDKDGKVSNADDAGVGWMFEAADGLMAMIPVKDDDYVSYGFWLTKDKKMPTGFNVFYNGEGMYDTAVSLPNRPAVDAEDIMATYEGDAAGKYLVRDSSGDATAGPGYFTATAMLEAVIRPTEATGDANPYTVSGQISDFMDGTTMPLGDLVVTLKDRDRDPDTAYDDSSVAFNGPTSGSTDPLGNGTGMWEAEFFGPDSADDQTRGGFPAAAAGAFNYSWGLGAVQGAFGAEYVAEEE